MSDTKVRVLTFIECSPDFEYPIIEEFGEYSKTNLSEFLDEELYEARNYLLKNTMSFENTYITPHKRIKHLCLVDKKNYSEDLGDYVKYCLTNKNNIKLPIPHGCWNRTIKDYIRAPSGFNKDGIMTFKNIKHVMSKDCVYTIENKNDPQCSGCIHWRIRHG